MLGENGRGRGDVRISCTLAAVLGFVFRRLRNNLLDRTSFVLEPCPRFARQSEPRSFTATHLRTILKIFMNVLSDPKFLSSLSGYKVLKTAKPLKSPKFKQEHFLVCERSLSCLEWLYNDTETSVLHGLLADARTQQRSRASRRFVFWHHPC